MLFNRDNFFAKYRSDIDSLEQDQVDGLNTLLGHIENDSRWTNIPQIAYFLATIYHETAQTFQPVKERRGRPGTKIRAIQDRYWPSGYYGRGYVQITWEKNYRLFGIADNPDKALEPDTAYEIAAKGMLQGLFTGKKLSDFVSADKQDFFDARTVINGHDHAADIEIYAQHFLDILTASQQAPVQDTAPTPTTDPTPAVQPSLFAKARGAYAGASEGEKSLISRALNFVWVLFAGVFAFLQAHPISIIIIAIVAILGFVILHSYSRRQDMITKLKGT